MSSIFKRVQSWTGDENKHSLVVKRLDNSTCKMAVISRVKRAFQGMTSLIKSHVLAD
ncbi:hypothetical protein DPMN_009481 [Dreissena polymorpha]|uniref:Uncharacterized protein n=1 Tax=Dreissena polymorpha TaxID=45954 RepID=A0A9D4MX08_DREPO|nr:hypothetical protein DPMN_009481 [Dreissena polymorpha]